MNKITGNHLVVIAFVVGATVCAIYESYVFACLLLYVACHVEFK